MVDKNSEEAEIIMQYVKNTHAATHNTYTLEVDEVSWTHAWHTHTHIHAHTQCFLEPTETTIFSLQIFKIVREGEYQRFRPFKDLHNRQLLWHGSRTTNYAGILSQGLRIAPPEAPVVSAACCLFPETHASCLG